MNTDRMDSAITIFCRGEAASGHAGTLVAVQHELWSGDIRIAFRDDAGVVYVRKERTGGVAVPRHINRLRYWLSRHRYTNDGEEVEDWEVWKQR